MNTRTLQPEPATASREPAPHSRRLPLALGAAVVAGAALTFQAVHVVEHATQLGHWFATPRAAPWMTPWAIEAKHWLAVGGDHALGAELLHLIGNLIFLVGLVALVVFRATGGHTLAQSPSLRAATIVQSVHVIEHLVLTATVALGTRAIGISTFVGLVDGAAMTSWRVWFHFLINLIATALTATALIATPTTSEGVIVRCAVRNQRRQPRNLSPNVADG